MTTVPNNYLHVVNDMFNVDARKKNYKCFKTKGFRKLLKYFRKAGSAT